VTRRPQFFYPPASLNDPISLNDRTFLQCFKRLNANGDALNFDIALSVVILVEQAGCPMEARRKCNVAR
jgi:hypothetical protein